MKRIGIVGSGIGGLHLGLYLLDSGIHVTLYADRTPAQQRARQLSNIVCRNAPTRERERQLGVAHWDDEAPDLTCMSVSVVGAQGLAFSGALTPPCQVVDMRMYWARLLEDFVGRGGRVQVGAIAARDVEAISAEHSLTVVASGRGSLSNLFARVPEHSPYAEPQRLVVAGLFRGIRFPDPVGFDVFVNRGQGEILSFPLHSFEPGLTGVAFEIIRGGAFTDLGRMRYDDDPRAFETAVCLLLRDYAPGIHERIDDSSFGVARPSDVGHVAITPMVRRGYARLPSGRMAVALGDAHVVMDPITGQGANKASHDAFVLGAAIRDADAFDDAFCATVERSICAYALPVSEACNARLVKPAPHVGRLLGTAARHQGVADLYCSGFQSPDRFWGIISSPERTTAMLDQFEAQGPPALTPYATEVWGPTVATT